jgi:hypothetical protein
MSYYWHAGRKALTVKGYCANCTFPFPKNSTGINRIL